MSSIQKIDLPYYRPAVPKLWVERPVWVATEIAVKILS